MKRIYDMDESEVLALTDEMINRLIDYECANEGVPLLPPHPGAKPKAIDIKPDTTIYKVGEWNFINVEDANRVFEVLATSTLCDVDGYSKDARIGSIITTNHYSYPQVKTIKVMSSSLYIKEQSQIATVAVAEEEWGKANKIYNQAYAAREGIVGNAWEVVRMAREHEAACNKFRADFARYLELADGDRVIAMNFLTKANEMWDLTFFSDLIQELCPGYAWTKRV